jgi:hypothetical protein
VRHEQISKVKVSENKRAEKEAQFGTHEVIIMDRNEWNKVVNRVVREAKGRCHYCGAPSNRVHGVRGNHDEGAMIVVCKKCHDKIHNEERNIYRIHRSGVWNKEDMDYVEAQPRSHRVRAKAAKPSSMDDIPEGC